MVLLGFRNMVGVYVRILLDRRIYVKSCYVKNRKVTNMLFVVVALFFGSFEVCICM